jgi:carboxyl-terminal processing protease
MFSSPARSRRIWPLALAIVVVLIAGVWLGGHSGWIPSGVRSAFAPQNSAETQVQNVLSLISKNYYRKVNTQQLVNDGLVGAVASLNDPYSHYYPPGDLGTFEAETQGPKDSGIGVDVNAASQGLALVEVFPGSPAARAGLVPGDVITAVGSKRLAGLTLDKQSRLVSGRAGTKVTLTVLRNGHERRVTVERANVVVPVAYSQILDYHGKKLGYLEFMYGFTQGSAGELRQQVQKVIKQGAQGLILDMRDNPGGLLTQAIGVASIFLSNGTIVTTRGRNQPTYVYTAQGNAIAPSIPLVVLVNRYTASSAEIVTAALKERGRAKVVGTRTYGKGVFQETQTLPNGGVLDITVGEFFTPNGTNLGGPGVASGKSVARGPGVSPNVYVYDNPNDPGLKALTVGERVLAGEVH